MNEDRILRTAVIGVGSLGQHHARNFAELAAEGRCSLAAVCDIDESRAAEIAAMPIESLVATKKLLLSSRLDAVRAARERENVSFAGLVGGPANREAIAAFREHRKPDFTKHDAR